MTTIDPDTRRGLYGKYRVEKVNGKPVGECFVLEEHDPHAVAALRAYAQSCIARYSPLAADVMIMADRWAAKLGCTCSAPDYQDEFCPLHGRGA